MRELGFVSAVVRLEDAAVLDPIVNRVKAVVDAVIRPQAVRDALHGVPIGHAVHPLIVTVPIGAWASVALLDLLPDTSRTTRILVGLGVATALPSAVTGYTDWSQLHEQQMRVGIVHSAANVIATGLYTASFVQRCRGRQPSGKALAYLGLAVASAGGYLGGHLTYRQAAAVNHTEDVPHLFPTGWHTLAPLDEIPENELTGRDVEGQPLVILRRGSRLDVLSATCSHLSAPLQEGELIGLDGGESCVVCPWHNSVFSVDTGEVVHGPATSPQPKFRTRLTNGLVEIMLPGAG